ncbi:hypothetical protein BC2230_110155 [Burkholderia cepacia]
MTILASVLRAAWPSVDRRQRRSAGAAVATVRPCQTVDVFAGGCVSFRPDLLGALLCSNAHAGALHGLPLFPLGAPPRRTVRKPACTCPKLDERRYRAAPRH